MNRPGFGSFLFLLLVIIAVSLGVMGLGARLGIDAMRKQAIEAGVGKYTVDPLTGHTRFVFVAHDGTLKDGL